MSEQIYLIQPGRVFVPARLDIFKLGGGIRLAIQAGASHMSLVGKSSDMLAELERLAGEATVLAAELERAAALTRQAIATNDQGHVSRVGVKV